jgi:hypothetical protein
MGKSSGGSPSIMMIPQQQQSSSTVSLPGWVDQAAQENLRMANDISGRLPGPYTGQRVADMTQGQLSAIDAINQNVGSTQSQFADASSLAQQAYQSAQPGFQQAMNLSGQALNPASVRDAIAGLNQASQRGYNNVQASGDPLASSMQTLGSVYNPAAGGVRSVAGAQDMIGQSFNPIYQATNPAISSLQQSVNDARGLQGFQADRVSAQSLPQGDIASYMNPYTENVINSSLRTLDKQRLNSLNANADGAIGSNAGFGSRAALQDAITNAEFGGKAASLNAELQGQNFQQAQQALQSDQARRMQADLANQSAGLQGAGVRQNAAQLTGNLANTLGGLGLNAGQFGISAGNAYGNLGLQNAQTGISQANTMGQLGLSARGQDITAQQANQDAALRNQSNQISAIQNAGSLGLQNAGLTMQGAGQLGSLANTYAGLGIDASRTLGDLAGSGQQAFLSGANSGLDASGLLQSQQQNQLTADQQAIQDQRNALVDPINLRLQALGQTPYGQTTTGSSFGLQGQAYQPTSSSPFMGLLGAGLTGLRAASGLGWQPLGR